MSLFDISYKVATPSLGLDIYQPKGARAPTPAILYYHGGAWIEGDKDGIDNGFKLPIKEALLEEGIAVISVNYSLLTPDTHFPSNIEDCLDATRFIRKHAAWYNINPERIGVMGTSAGAHLALLQAYSDHEDYACAPELSGFSAKVNYLVNIYGPTDLSNLFPLQQLDEDRLEPDMYRYVCHLVRSMTGFDAVHQAQDASRVLANYCPINLIESDRAQLIPTLTLHGEADEIVPLSQAQSLHAELNKKGAQHSFYSYPNVKHAFEQMSASQEDEMREQCLDFIVSHA